MTKRILAAFLAVMMVVAMVPTTVFAAGTCAVDKYDAHSKAHCDLEGVKYTKVEYGTVEAACGQDGYTLYKCACGVFFADDIVRAPQKHTATVATTPLKPATCAEDGKVAIYTCTNEGCGKTFMKAEEIAAAGADEEGVIPATGEHNYKTNGTEANCMEAENKCTVCGKAKPGWEAQDAHTYVYNDPEYYVVKKAPTEAATGEIWYYCTYPGCEHHKVVTIRALDHTHVLEKVTEKKTGEGCITATVAEHYKCTKCGKLFTDNAGANETTLEELTTTTDHAWNTDPVIIEPSCTTWGFSYYGCPVCGATKGVTPETEKDDMTKYAPLGHIYYKCKTHGCTTKDTCTHTDCQECKDVLAYCDSYVKTEPGCETDGKHEWNCRRTWKDQAGNPVTCDYTCPAEKINKTGHKLSEKVIIPATHYLPYAIEFQYCTNANCNNVEGVATQKVTTWTYDDNGTPVAIDLLRYAKNGNVYDLPADDANISGYKVVAATVKVTKITKVANQVHYYKEHVYNKPTCEGTGETFYYCPDCMLDGCQYMEQTKPLGHTYGTSTAAKKNDIAATCTTNAFKVCDRAGCNTGPNGGAHQLEQPGTMGHTWDTANPHVVLPTCKPTEGYTYYDCKKCTEKYTVPGSETTYEWKAYYETKAEADEVHNLASVYEVQEGNCLIYGYYKYPCLDCGRNVAVLIDGTGKGHSAPTTVYEEATCTQWKGYEEYICTKCGETVPKKVEQEALGHDPLTHDAVAATCLATGNDEYFECKRCGKFFSDEECTTEIEEDSWITPKLSHNWTRTEEVDECDTPGFIHNICDKGCCDGEGKGEYVNGYVDAVKHNKTGDKEHKDATCIEDGFDKFYCSICDELQETVVITAKGHKNAAGQVITTKCTDTVSDRVCVQCNEGFCDDKCNEDVVLNDDDKWEVITLCTEVPVYAPNSCEHYGYVGITCANECGTKDVIIEILEPTGHKAPWLVEDKDGQLVNQVIMKDEKVTVDEDVIDALNYTLDEEAGESYTAPTYEALGSFTFKCCNECGRLITVDVIRTGVDFTIKMDNAAVAGANTDEDGDFAPVDGDVIAVEIYANAYNTDVWGFNFDVNYSAYSLNFLGYKFDAKEIFAKSSVDNLTSDESVYEDVNNDGIKEQVILAEDYKGQVKVSAYTENVDGKIKDATINGTVKVVTLYFQVEAQFDYTELGVAMTDFDHDIYVDMEELDENDNWVFSGAVVNSKGDVECTGDWYETEATAMLDTNADKQITISDLFKCNQILTGEAEEEYLASADANKDGQVTITDLGLMNQLLQGADEVVIYKALSWTAPEGFVAA